MSYKEKRIGEKRTNRQGCIFTIIDYRNCWDIDIQFDDVFGHISKNNSYQDISKGRVKNPYFLSCCNFGYHGYGKYNTKKNKNFYQPWLSLIRRSKSKSLKMRHPAYENVDCCNTWANFQVFSEWMENNYNPETMQGWQLDKDILIKGNKIYSPETCCFVPRQINMLFVKGYMKRGGYPIGVYKHLNGKFIALNSIGKSKQEVLGSFDTPEEAFQAYKIAKEKHIKEVADKWKDLIDPRVYEALYNYHVDITD